MLDVGFRCLFGVVSRVVEMALGAMGVVCRQFGVARLIVLRNFAVMASRVLVMFGCLLMMLCRLL
jgi:hypothetical protein